MKVILTKAGVLNTGKTIFYKNCEANMTEEDFNSLPDDIKDCFTVIVEDKKDETPAVVDAKAEADEVIPTDANVKAQEEIEQEEKKEAEAIAKAAAEGTPVLKTDNGKDIPAKNSIPNRNGRNRNA